MDTNKTNHCQPCRNNCLNMHVKQKSKIHCHAGINHFIIRGPAFFLITIFFFRAKLFMFTYVHVYIFHKKSLFFLHGHWQMVLTAKQKEK